MSDGDAASAAVKSATNPTRDASPDPGAVADGAAVPESPKEPSVEIDAGTLGSGSASQPPQGDAPTTSTTSATPSVKLLRFRIQTAVRRFVVLVDSSASIGHLRTVVGAEFTKLYGALEDTANARYKALSIRPVPAPVDGYAPAIPADVVLRDHDSLLSVLRRYRCDTFHADVQLDSQDTTTTITNAPFGASSASARTHQPCRKRRYTPEYTHAWLAEKRPNDSQWVNGFGLQAAPTQDSLGAEEVASAGDAVIPSVAQLPTCTVAAPSSTSTDSAWDTSSLLHASWTGFMPLFPHDSFASTAEAPAVPPSIITTHLSPAHTLSTPTASTASSVTAASSLGSVPPTAAEAAWAHVKSLIAASACQHPGDAGATAATIAERLVADRVIADRAVAEWFAQLAVKWCGGGGGGNGDRAVADAGGVAVKQEVVAAPAMASVLFMPHSMVPFVRIAKSLAQLADDARQACVDVQADARLKAQCTLDGRLAALELASLAKTEDGDDVAHWLTSNYPGDPFAVIDRLANAYLVRLSAGVDLHWLMAQQDVCRSNVAPDALRAWRAGILAALLAELGVVESARALLA